VRPHLKKSHHKKRAGEVAQGVGSSMAKKKKKKKKERERERVA
jgi:hypothetical protein